MNCLFENALANPWAIGQPGAVNLDLTRTAEKAGLYFAPDPSGQKSCTIHRNAAENADGPHTLAYRVTANQVAAPQGVLPEEEIVCMGARALFAGNGVTFATAGSLGLLCRCNTAWQCKRLR
jgi:glycolate oxidase